jgi:amino acid permease
MGSDNTRRAVMGCIGEPTALFPVNGPNFEFVGRFLDQSLGLSAAWLLWYGKITRSDAIRVS